MIPDCEKCLGAIEAVNSAYLNATPEYRRQMLVREAATMLDIAGEIGSCPPGGICGMLKFVIEEGRVK